MGGGLLKKKNDVAGKRAGEVRRLPGKEGPEKGPTMPSLPSSLVSLPPSGW